MSLSQEEQKQSQLIKRMEQLSGRMEQSSNQIGVSLEQQNRKLGGIEQEVDKVVEESGKTKYLAKKISSFAFFIKEGVKNQYSSWTNSKSQIQPNQNKKEQKNEEKKVQGSKNEEISEEDPLDQITQQVKRVKKMGVNIGNEIDSQNQKIDRIQQKMNTASQNIDYARTKINKKL